MSRPRPDRVARPCYLPWITTSATAVTDGRGCSNITRSRGVVTGSRSSRLRTHAVGRSGLRDRTVRSTPNSTARAMGLLEHAADHGMYPYRFYAEYCPSMEPLRGNPDFDRIVAKAQRRVEAFAL